jgi:hypothetical protein
MRTPLQYALRVFLLASAIASTTVRSSAQTQQPGQLTPQQFQANPAQILASYPNGGSQMISLIRQLTLADPADLPLVIGLLPKANDAQGTAIGSGLGQAALASVSTNQAYATEIQRAVVDTKGFGSGGNGGRSTQLKIGNAVTTENQVDGVTDKGIAPITTGNEVYLNEVVRTGLTGKAQMLLSDHTNLAVAPVTEIRLDKFIYDPNGGSGNVVLVASSGAFRFITGVQPHQDYEIKTPYATMGVRGTQFIVLITPDAVKIELLSGEVVVTTVSGNVVTMSTPSTVLSVDSQGNTQGPTPTDSPLVDFADLGPPVTNLSFADALDAFSAVTGDVGTGSTANLNTFVVSTPSDFLTLNFTGSASTPGALPTTTTGSTSVSPSH